MTREEFEDNVREVCESTGKPLRSPNVEEMGLIDYVYMYHPSLACRVKERSHIYM